jgi:hypothetical protein
MTYIPSSPGRTSQRAACAELILFHQTWNCHHAPPDGTRHTHFSNCGPGHLAVWDSVPRHGKHPISTKKPHLTPRSRRTAPTVSPRHVSQCPHCQSCLAQPAHTKARPAAVMSHPPPDTGSSPFRTQSERYPLSPYMTICRRHYFGCMGPIATSRSERYVLQRLPVPFGPDADYCSVTDYLVYRNSPCHTYVEVSQSITEPSHSRSSEPKPATLSATAPDYVRLLLAMVLAGQAIQPLSVPEAARIPSCP